MTPSLKMLGRRFGRLVCVDVAAGRGREGRALGLFLCDCGKEKIAPIGRVRLGYVQSCGCYKGGAGIARTHGMRYSSEYRVWVAMIGRCHSPTHKDYPRWGACGITVCEEWRKSFDTFYSHIGPRPPGTSIDRLDNAKGYEPGNVRWATAREQARNRKKPLCIIDTPLGRMAVVDYGPLIGITPEAARRRLKKGKLKGCRQVSP